jgi:hypothetical protein
VSAVVTGVHRLAFGLEVADAVRGGLADVVVAEETVPTPYALPKSRDVGAMGAHDQTLGLPRLSRGRRPGRFRRLYRTESATESSVTVRIADGTRRYVPRRLIIRFDPLTDVLAREGRGDPWTPVVHRVAVFPGCGFGPHGATTGLRGRVLHAHAPVPWVRVTARHETIDQVVGWAHGDDRGEFLLILRPGPTALAVPAAFRLPIRLTIAAPPASPPATPLGVPDDPLARLVAEELTSQPNDVSPGTVPPPGYTTPLETTVELRLGRLLSPPTPFQIP